MPPGEAHQVPRQDVKGHLPGDGGEGEEVPLKPHGEGPDEEGEEEGEPQTRKEPKPRGGPKPQGEEGGGVGGNPHEGRLGEAGHPRKAREDVEGQGHHGRKGEEGEEGEVVGEGQEKEGE